MSRVTIDWGKFKGLLRDSIENTIRWSIDRQERQIEKALTREKVADQVRAVLGDIPELKPYEREKGAWGPAASKLSDTLRTTWGEMSKSDDPKADAVFDLFRELHDVVDESDLKSHAEIEKEQKEYEKEILKETETYANTVKKAVEAAIHRAENWSGVPVRIKVRVPWDAEMGRDSITGPSDDFSVYLGNKPMSPDFTVFTDKGKIVGIDDVLEAGDRDFFHDPALELSYFHLVMELKKPGSSKKPGKNLTLWTARPTKDRKLYQDAKHVPTNIFLTTDSHRAYGIAHDLGGHEVRDLWKMVINEKYLLKTLEAGHVRDYQTIGQKQVPVVRSTLIHQGEANMYGHLGAVLQEVRENLDAPDMTEEEIEERLATVLHWVKQKHGAAKMAAHRAFVKMVRKDPAAHRRKMRQDARYHRIHKWHDQLMRKTHRSGWVRRHVRAHMGEDYRHFCDFGCGAYSAYLKAHPDIDSDAFAEYVSGHNKADRDMGELEDIAAFEIERLGNTFAKLHERDPGQAFMDVPFELRVTSGAPTMRSVEENTCVCPRCGYRERRGGKACSTRPCPKCGRKRLENFIESRREIDTPLRGAERVVWYHGSDRPLSAVSSKPIYLTTAPALARLNAGPRGHVAAFKLKSGARWYDIGHMDAPGLLPSMDSLGYDRQAMQKLKAQGVDVAWDASDFHRGQDQIVVLTPKLLKRVEGAVSEAADPESMKVQTLIFAKTHFTRKSAMKWAASHGFKIAKVTRRRTPIASARRTPAASRPSARSRSSRA